MKNRVQHVIIWVNKTEILVQIHESFPLPGSFKKEGIKEWL